MSSPSERMDAAVEGSLATLAKILTLSPARTAEYEAIFKAIFAYGEFSAECDRQDGPEVRGTLLQIAFGMIDADEEAPCKT